MNSNLLDCLKIDLVSHPARAEDTYKEMDELIDF